MMLSILALAVIACGGSGYVYAPKRAQVTPDGQIFTKVGIPAGQGRGDVRIASRGVRRVSSSTGAQVDALLVRMIVTNDSHQQPWSLDTRQQLMLLPSGLRTPPLLVRAKGAAGPIVTIECRGRSVVDLYYVVPPAGLATLHEFDLLWQVDTGDRLVSQRTEFDRVRVASYVDPQYANDDVGVEWGYWPDRPVVVLRDSPEVISSNELRDDVYR